MKQWAKAVSARAIRLPSYTPVIMNMLQRHLITVHVGCQRHFDELGEHTIHLLIGFSC